MYGPAFPREEVVSSRGYARRAALYEDHKAHGAVFGEGFGWERPLYFLRSEDGAQRPLTDEMAYKEVWASYNSESSSSTAAAGRGGGRSPTTYSYNLKDTEWFHAEARECRAARQGVAIFDMSPFGKIRVQGADAEQLVQYTVPANVSAARCAHHGGAVVYTPWCNDHGYLLGDLTVSAAHKDDYYCVLPAADPLTFLDQLRRHTHTLHLSNVQCVDVTEDMSVLAVMGPSSLALLRHAFPDHPWTQHDMFTRQRLKTAGELSTSGIEALRISFIGELGWELHIPVDHTKRVLDALRAAAEHTVVRQGAPFEMAGSHALLTSLRVEKGFVHVHHDITDRDTPFEAGLGWAIDFTASKPKFCGKDALMAMKKQPLRKRLVSVSVDAEIGLWGGEKELVLNENGRIVGALTSAGYSHTLNKAIGLASIDVPQGEGTVKTRIEAGSYTVRAPVNGELQDFPATISLKALVDPSNERTKIPHH